MNFKFTEHSDRIFTGLILATIAGLFALSGALIRFDNFFYDLGRHSGVKLAPEDILIVAIDEASLNKIGHWPWPHSLHAALLNKLAAEHPRVIGFDMLLSGQEHGDEDVNQALSSAIGQAKNVVMPMRLEVPHIGASAKQRMPAPSLASQVAGVGRDHAPLDYDGVVRSIYLWEGVAAGGLSAVGLPHFARSVLQVANQLPSSYRVVNSELKVPKSALKGGSHVIERLVSYERRRVGFLGPPGHFQSISYAKVLSGDYPNSYFKDRIVLVGITAAGLGDAYITPLSSASQPMPGVELNANVIASMRSQQLVSESPLWFTCLICILLAVLPLFWLHKLPPRKSLLANTGYFFVVLSLAIILMQVFHLWITPASALLAILLAYPIWKWRRMDSAQLFLDKELQHLRDELAALGM